MRRRCCCGGVPECNPFGWACSWDLPNRMTATWTGSLTGNIGISPSPASGTVELIHAPNDFPSNVCVWRAVYPVTITLNDSWIEPDPGACDDVTNSINKTIAGITRVQFFVSSANRFEFFVNTGIDDGDGFPTSVWPSGETISVSPCGATGGESLAVLGVLKYAAYGNVDCADRLLDTWDGGLTPVTRFASHASCVRDGSCNIVAGPTRSNKFSNTQTLSTATIDF